MEVQIHGQNYFAEQIGEGGFGKVYKMTNVETKEVHCLKIIEETEIETNEIKIH